MAEKFDQRVLTENFITKMRKLGEDVSALKFRGNAGVSVAGGSGGGDASDVTYTPATNADWNGSVDPGDVDNALDQLAERAKDLEAFTGMSSPVAYGFEVGMIIQWSGAIVDIPDGWQLCDGTNGTPDLRDKFIVGAGSTYSPGNTGGAATHDHDYDDVINHTHPASVTDPGHNHTQNAHNHTQDPHQHGMAEGTTDGSGTFMDRSNAAAATTAVTDNATATNQAATATNIANTTGISVSTSNPAGGVATGTTTTDNHLPPYYALAFIMCMELGAGVAVHTHDGIDGSGWMPVSWASPTRVSATVFTVAQDVTGVLQKGYKLKVTDTTTKYFLVLSVSFGSGVTTITTVATSDYAFVGNPSNISYSNVEEPFGYPLSFNYAGVASPGSGAFSGSPVVESKFSTVAGLMYVTFRLNLTTAIINTGTGELRMAMPVNAAAAVVANGRENAVIGSQLQGLITSASNLCRIFTYNNAVPMVNNYQIYMNVTMMW